MADLSWKGWISIGVNVVTIGLLAVDKIPMDTGGLWHPRDPITCLKVGVPGHRDLILPTLPTPFPQACWRR